MGSDHSTWGPASIMLPTVGDLSGASSWLQEDNSHLLVGCILERCEGKFKTKWLKSKHHWEIGVFFQYNPVTRKVKPGTPKLNIWLFIWDNRSTLLEIRLLKTFMMVPIQAYMGEFYRRWNSIDRN